MANDVRMDGESKGNKQSSIFCPKRPVVVNVYRTENRILFPSFSG